MKSLFFIFMLFLIATCLQCIQDHASQTSNSKSALPDSSGNIGKNSKLSYKITNAPEKTFGYDIYADNRILIHQQNVPSQPGNKGFLTKTEAEKVAWLVMGKLKKGEMPPTVSKEELKNLNVIK